LDKYRRFYSLVKFEFDFTFVNDENAADNGGGTISFKGHGQGEAAAHDDDADEVIRHAHAHGRILAPPQVRALIQTIVYRVSCAR
jgi:hypothetical protein